MKLGTIVTVTPSLASPGTRCLQISAESREAFASVILELMRHWEHVTIGEPSQLPRSGWWYGTGHLRNEIAATSRERVSGEMTLVTDKGRREQEALRDEDPSGSLVLS
jgi:hypothetical protein